jgi:hypothetical protein
MSAANLIEVTVFCTHQQVDLAFVLQLRDRGLIRLTEEQETFYLEAEEMSRVEQLTRMHYDLDINLEGIEALSHMLERVQRMQHELRELQERLRLYETGDR